MRSKVGNSTAIFRLRDLTAAYKDITDDMPKGQIGVDDPLAELFRRMDEDVKADIQPETT